MFSKSHSSRWERSWWEDKGLFLLLWQGHFHWEGEEGEMRPGVKLQPNWGVYSFAKRSGSISSHVAESFSWWIAWYRKKFVMLTAEDFLPNVDGQHHVACRRSFTVQCAAGRNQTLSHYNLFCAYFLGWHSKCSLTIKLEDFHHSPTWCLSETLNRS